MRQDNALIDRLKNRGPVTLSSDNPYLAANLLLSREMASSPELSGFVQHRGTPTGMAVEKQIFGALTLHFYYLDKSEHYTLEESDGLWIISAPQALRPEEERALRHVDSPSRPPTDTSAATNSAALLTPTTVATKAASITNSAPTALPSTVPTERIIASVSSSIATNVPTAIALKDRGFKSLPQASTPVAIEITPLPTRSEATPKSVRTPIKATLAPTSVPAIVTPVPIRTELKGDSAIVERIRTKLGGEQAEITPRGDLVHYVTSDGENLDLITLWYTLDRTNAGRVARVNNLGEKTRLNIGDTVVIPAYLLRNKSRLGEAAMSELKQALPPATHAATNGAAQAAQGQTNAAVTPQSLGSEAALEREKRK